MKRLDAWLVDLGLAPSRTKAQELIIAGDVQVHALAFGKVNALMSAATNAEDAWQVVTQASRNFTTLTTDSVRVNVSAPSLKYVSRGGLKLEGALKHRALNVTGMRVLDVGISTGGFADCLLQHGCREVIGLDVGKAQLAKKLFIDPRVSCYEGVNAREISAHPKLMNEMSKGFDLFVVDVSFISLQLVIPPLAAVLPAKMRGFLLVKPQFELDAAALDKKGIVRDLSLHQKAVEQVLRSLEKCGFSINEHFPSQIKGQDGNQEFFVDTQR